MWLRLSCMLDEDGCSLSELVTDGRVAVTHAACSVNVGLRKWERVGAMLERDVGGAEGKTETVGRREEWEGDQRWGLSPAGDLKKTLFYFEEMFPPGFSLFLMAVQKVEGQRSPLRGIFKFLSSFFVNVTSVVGRMSLSQARTLLWVCVCFTTATAYVCVLYHLQINLQITGHECLSYVCL